MRAAVVAGLIVLQPTVAAAQARCGERDMIVERLQVKWSEVRVSAGLTASGKQILEIFASDATGTWTALLVQADGVACVVAAGTDWMAVAKPPDGDPA